MATIDELIASIEVELEAAQKRGNKAISEVKLITEVASKEGRANLTPEEDQRVAELFAARDAAKADAEGIKRKLANAVKVKEEEDEAARAASDTHQAARKPAYDQVARVGAEERTYHKGNDPDGAGFLRDVCRQFLYQDVAAGTRLARHMAEERVERAEYLQRAAGDLLTGGLGGLVVPQYLVDMVAPMAAAMRPFADMCVKHTLPPNGMTVYIPTISTATSAALQATQLTGVSATSLAETDITVVVNTAAGQQTVSRQAIDRGTGIDNVVLQDLFNRYNTVLDSTLINTATTGLAAVAASTLGAFADTQPTGAKLYPKILAAASGVEAGMLAMGQPTHAVMHSRRWYWLAKEMTSTWPLVNYQGIPPQAGATANPNSSYDSGVRGVLPNGLKVVVDNNCSITVSTNQDEIYVVPQAECHLWEDPGQPAFIRAEQPAAASLGVLLVVYGYFAYCFQRYPAGAFQKVSGTGLTTPSW